MFLCAFFGFIIYGGEKVKLTWEQITYIVHLIAKHEYSVKNMNASGYTLKHIEKILREGSEQQKELPND